MEWLVNREKIAKDLIKTTKIDLKKNYVNVYAYVLTDKEYIGNVTDSVKSKLLKDLICEIYEVDKSLIFTLNRKRELVDARHALAYFLRKTTKYSFSNIGEIMASPLRNRDHATILHSVKVYNDLLDTEVYHKRRCLIIQEEYNKRLSDIDLTNTYTSKCKNIVANFNKNQG